MKKVLARANANIALIKYWGKRDENLFLPTKSSLSVSLDALETKTELSFVDDGKDYILFDDIAASPSEVHKISTFLDLLRKKLNLKKYFVVNTKNNFPTAAGLASSSSGFAALTLAVNKLCGLNLSNRELSILARQGSGSACRSVFGGFVLWNKGVSDDGRDSFAEQIFDHMHWPEFRVLIVVTDSGQKLISSREAMQNSLQTSPFYKTWVEDSETNLPLMQNNIAAKNIIKVGLLAELDCLDMHKTMWTAHPPINYWTDSTHKVIDTVLELQNQKVPCFYTIDAGPNVKVICLDKDVSFIKNRLQQESVVKNILTSKVAADPVVEMIV